MWRLMLVLGMVIYAHKDEGSANEEVVHSIDDDIR